MNGDPIQGTSRQRLDNIDALRGLALAGMLIVHFQYYAHDSGQWAQRISMAVDNLAENRFYPLFSMLFGAGFALQMERWGERPGFVAMYLRRLSALMVIAILLIAFSGYAVLEAYAFWGLVVVLTRKWSIRALTVLLLLSALSGPIAQVGLYAWERKTMSMEESNKIVRSEWKAKQDFELTNDRLRDQRQWVSMMKLRLRFHFAPYLTWRNYVPFHPLMMMLVGVLAVRLRVLHDPQSRKKLLWGLLIGGTIALPLDVGMGHVPWLQTQSLRLSAVRSLVAFSLLEQLQALAYAAALVLWMNGKPAIPRFAAVLASMGRLSLTNYVLQIAILETIFGSSTPLIAINRWGGLAGVVVVLTLQVIFSRWWMSRFRYGLLEWLWRSATLGRWQSLSRSRANAAMA